MSLCVHVGIQVGGLFANGPKQLCLEPDVDTMAGRSYILLKRYPEPHGQVTAYNRSRVH